VNGVLGFESYVFRVGRSRLSMLLIRRPDPQRDSLSAVTRLCRLASGA
jgi:hypothetical protein